MHNDKVVSFTFLSGSSGSYLQVMLPYQMRVDTKVSPCADLEATLNRLYEASKRRAVLHDEYLKQCDALERAKVELAARMDVLSLFEAEHLLNDEIKSLKWEVGSEKREALRTLNPRW